MVKNKGEKCTEKFYDKSDISKNEAKSKGIGTCSHRVCQQKENSSCNPCQECFQRDSRSHIPIVADKTSSKSMMKRDSKNERIREAVDNLLKKFNQPSCCGQCPTESRSPCKSYRYLLNLIQESQPKSLWNTTCGHCGQTEGDYEQDIIEEINRRIALGLCGHTQPHPALDYAQVPKKKPKPKKKVPPPPKPEPPPKPPPKVKKPPPPKPPKPVIPPRIVFRTPKNFKIDDAPVGEGTIQYRLSNPEFITIGWTKLPPSRELFYTFQTEPCVPLLDPKIWRKKQSFRYYPNGKMMARIERDGSVEVYYLCGDGTAIQVTQTGLDHYRVVVFFNRDEYVRTRQKPVPSKDQPAAIFDSYGNGVVYDTKGKIRLFFDQAEGTLFDFPDRKKCCNPDQKVKHPPLHWKWQNFQQIALKRRLLYDQTYGCSNFEEKYPDFKQYLPRPKSPSSPDDGKNNGNSDIEKRKSSPKTKRKSQNNTTKNKSHLPAVNTKNKEKMSMHSKMGGSHSTSRGQSGSSIPNSSPPSTRSSTNKAAASTRWKKLKRKVLKSGPLQFEVGASKLELADPAMVSEDGGKSNVETPIRLVMRIENNVSLVIMNQCHIHLVFHEGMRHLVFNLGVHVKPNQGLKSEDFITVSAKLPFECQITKSEAPSLHNMFSIYAETSHSLQKLVGQDMSGKQGKDSAKSSKKTKESLIISHVDSKRNTVNREQSRLVKISKTIASKAEGMHKSKAVDSKSTWHGMNSTKTTTGLESVKLNSLNSGRNVTKDVINNTPNVNVSRTFAKRIECPPEDVREIRAGECVVHWAD